jgi:asparagine synthase (glutamine-hydrolysing)
VPLVEFALQLPDRLKIARGRRKVALLRAMRGIVPDAVRARRDKIAFAPPQRRWLSEAAPRLAHLAVRPRLESEGFVRAGTVAGALDRAAAGSADDPAGWRALISEMWLRRA